MKDEVIGWKERFSSLPLDKENKPKEGSWETWCENSFILCVFIGKRRKMNM
jgi:hypothetical protein